MLNDLVNWFGLTEKTYSLLTEIIDVLTINYTNQLYYLDYNADYNQDNWQFA